MKKSFPPLATESSSSFPKGHFKRVGLAELPPGLGFVRNQRTPSNPSRETATQSSNCEPRATSIWRETGPITKSFSDWLHDKLEPTHALTVTFRRRSQHLRPSTNDDVVQAIRHFLRVLSTQCYGSRTVRKRNARIPAAVVTGRGQHGNHPHAHFALRRPDFITRQEFETHIYFAIKKTWLINRETHLAPYENKGWIEYLMHHGIENFLLDFLSI